jgi:hypothetical protein
MTGALAKKGIAMKFLAVIAAIGALSQPALAQTGDCKRIADAKARLACYDKASPLAASAAKPAAAKPIAGAPAKAAKIDSGKYVDAISAEDALMNARLKNICRGC